MADVDIIARLKLAGDSFNRDFRQEMTRVEGEAQKSANRLRSSFSAVKGLAVGMVAGIGVEQIARVVTNAVERIDDLGDAAQRLGVSAKFLQRFEYAAVSMDGSVEGARDSLGKFNKFLGDYANGASVAVKAAERLGINLRDSSGNMKSQEEAVMIVSDALAKLPNQYQKTTETLKFFGRAQEELIPMLSGGSKNLKAFGDELERSGAVISDEDVKRVGDMKQGWDQFSHILQSKVAKAVAENSQGLKDLGDLIENIAVNLVKAAAALGNFYKGLNQTSKRAEIATLKGQLNNPNLWDDKDPARVARKAQYQARIKQLEPAAAPQGKTIFSVGDIFSIRRNFLPAEDMGLGTFAPVSASAEKLNTAIMQARADWSGMVETAKVFDGQLGDMLSKMRDQHDLDMLRAQGLDEQASLIEDLRNLQADINSIEGLTTAERQAGYEALSQQLLVSRALVTATKQASEFAADFRDNYGKGDGQGINDVIAQEEKIKDYKFEAAQELADKQKEDAQQLADMYETLLSDGVGGVWREFKQQGKRIIAEIAAQWTLAMISGQKFSIGSVLGGGSSLLGAGSSLLSGAGGALPSILSVGGGIGGGVGGAAGASLAVPGIGVGVGAALGALSLAGSLLGGLKTKKGSATLGFTNGALGVVSTSGNSKSRIAAASDAGGTVADQLAQIADALGGSLNGGLSVSIGVRKKSYRVDTSGSGRTKGAGVLDFGNDQQAAIEAAIRDALQDGVVSGISQASKNILAAGGDLQKAINKAVSIEQLPKLLKERLDPVGAAIDAVDEKFTSLVATLKEAGASAEQIDQARQLYQLERADALKTQGGSASLKAFLTAMGSGSSSPFSLRTQRANAQSALDPFLAKIAAGSAIDVDQYLAAAQTFLDIERQIEGSRPGYFATVDRIQQATQQAIARIDGQSSVSTKDPFAELTAQATQATASLTEQSNALLQQMIAQLGSIGANLSGGAFIGSSRGFVSA